MKKKVISLVVIITLLITTLSVPVVASSVVSKEDNLEGLSCSTSASWKEHYASEVEMRESSDIVICGTVISSEPELRNDMVFTMNYIKVNLVETGNIEVDAVIPVLQTGGNVLGYSTPAISEIPLLEVGEEYKLYLSLTEYSEEYGQYYLISGGYQGVAKVKNNGSLMTLSDENTIFSSDDMISNRISTYAITYTPTKVYSWDQSSLVVYVQGDIRDRYHANTRTGICNGIHAWAEYTDSPSTSITISTVDADVCVYMYDYGETGWDAQTKTYYYTPSNICYYSRMTVNAYYLSGYYSTTGLWKAIACHEFGHTLGLEHNDSGSASIMRSYTKDYYDYVDGSPRYTVPKTADIKPINSKY